MDFSRLDTKSGASKGAALHLKHPALGHKLYTGEGADDLGQLVDKETASPVRIIVRGLESEVVRRQARQLRTDKDQETDDEEAGMAFVCNLVIGFEGLERDGEPMQPTEENKRVFFEQSDGLVKQVLDFAGDRAHFFGKG